ncbi:hypothetical protein L9F63_012188, partial [Diploptera punctata]
KNKNSSMNFDIPNEITLISKFINSTEDGDNRIVDGRRISMNPMRELFTFPKARQQMTCMLRAATSWLEPKYVKFWCLGQLYSLIQRHSTSCSGMTVSESSLSLVRIHLIFEGKSNHENLTQHENVNDLQRLKALLNKNTTSEPLISFSTPVKQSLGFAPWHVADQSRDEVFMAAQEAVGAHRDSQAWLTVSGSQTISRFPDGLMAMAAWTRCSGISGTGSYTSAGKMVSPNQEINKTNTSKCLSCPRCDRKYAVLYTLERHLRYECGVEKKFFCAVCLKRFKRSDVLKVHQQVPSITLVVAKNNYSLGKISLCATYAGPPGLQMYPGNICQYCGRRYKNWRISSYIISTKQSFVAAPLR